MLKISIITINLNNYEGLYKTLESVDQQTYPNYEFIIIDGGSRDGSVELIEKNKKIVKHWVSEIDSGVYNAINKGISYATGEYCLFLNSGDYFSNADVLENLFSSEIDNCDILYGNVHTNNKVISYPSKLSLDFLFHKTICHQATFIKTSLFKIFGNYNENLPFAADWEFLLKTIIQGTVSYKYIDLTICHYNTEGISSNPLNHKKILKEREDTLKQYFPMMYEDYLCLDSVRNELKQYKNSRLMQLVKKIQNIFLKRFQKRS